MRKMICEGVETLDFKPSGKVFVKPNVVFASKPETFGAHAYTPTSVLCASVPAIADSDGVDRVDVGENGAVGSPTRLFYKEAGYYREIAKLRKEAFRPIGIFCMDEELRNAVFVGGRVHDVLRVSHKMNRADAKVYLPKLKCHCVSNMTATVKLNVGICSDDEFYQWQDVNKELKRLNSPMRFFWGPYRHGEGDKCLTGCVMGLKMFLATFEQHAGAEAFAKARPVTFVIGEVDEEIDAHGEEVFLLGSCARAKINNASKIIRLDKCFTTAGDMHINIGLRLGMPSVLRDPLLLKGFFASILVASLHKCISLRYLQDMAYFMTKRLDRRL